MAQDGVKYSSYGIPFGLPKGDADSDGDVDVGDTADTDQIQTWIDAPAYDVRGDLDLDGDVDATDKSLASSVTLGWGKLSEDPDSGAGNRKGYAGYEFDSALTGTAGIHHLRNRVLIVSLGRWTRRDPMGYSDGPHLYQYVRNNPVMNTDPFGLIKFFFAFGGLPEGDGAYLEQLWKSIVTDEGGIYLRYEHHELDTALEMACDILQQKVMDPATGVCNKRHTISTLGFSRGGETALKFASRLQQLYRVQAELGFTADPVFFPPAPTALRWVNFYQRIDFLIKGISIPGADVDQQVFEFVFQRENMAFNRHMNLPVLNYVRGLNPNDVIALPHVNNLRAEVGPVAELKPWVSVSCENP